MSRKDFLGEEFKRKLCPLHGMFVRATLAVSVMWNSVSLCCVCSEVWSCAHTHTCALAKWATSHRHSKFLCAGAYQKIFKILYTNGYLRLNGPQVLGGIRRLIEDLLCSTEGRCISVYFLFFSKLKTVKTPWKLENVLCFNMSNVNVFNY